MPASPRLRLRSARLVPDDEPCDLVLRDGRVSIAAPEDPADVDEVVDLDGRWVLPGLWDHHVHFDQWAMARGRLDVSGAASALEATRLVADRLRADPPAAGATLVGYGFRAGLWPDVPHRDLLDTVAVDVPVVLAAWDLHSAWLNSAAARRYGVADHPTGLLLETEWDAVSQQLRVVPADVLDGWVADAARAAASRGVVGIIELDSPWQLDTWVRRVSDGIDELRVSCGVYPAKLDAAIERGLRTDDPAPGSADLVTMGPLKVISDGALNTRSAYCVDPYPEADLAEPHGILNVPPDELVPLLRRAWDHGITPAVHAIGDRANTLALDAFEAVGARGTIEHTQLLSPDDLPRFAALGITASVQPEHALDDRDVVERCWPRRSGRAFAYGSLAAAGARLALGSDAPVAPLDPWLAVGAAVHRARPGQEPWHPEQAIPIETALAASVRGRRLPISDGDPADLVVVEFDPLSAPVERLRAMPVAGTLLAGRWTWRSGI